MATPLRFSIRSCLGSSLTAFMTNHSPGRNYRGIQHSSRLLLKHPEDPQFVNEYALELPKYQIYDKKPFRMELEAGKKYAWCSCGTSKTQPLCDGSHKRLWGTAQKKTMPKYRPLVFKVQETKEYWMCNCKHTANQPFCDGTHRQQHIQDAVKS